MPSLPGYGDTGAYRFALESACRLPAAYLPPASSVAVRHAQSALSRATVYCTERCCGRLSCDVSVTVSCAYTVYVHHVKRACRDQQPILPPNPVREGVP